MRNHSARYNLPSMSRAFVKEPDGGEAFEDLPDRPISEHPNLVTPEGLAQIEETLARLHEEHGKAQVSRPTARRSPMRRAICATGRRAAPPRN